jgi:hypothetical protein
MTQTLEQMRASKVRYRAKVRSDALDAYGRVCACCGEAHEPFLTIDHVGNNGSIQAREIGGGKHCGKGHHLYQWLRAHGWPPGYQTLCWNCNAAKGRCPASHKALRARELAALL